MPPGDEKSIIIEGEDNTEVGENQGVNAENQGA